MKSNIDTLKTDWEHHWSLNDIEKLQADVFSDSPSRNTLSYRPWIDELLSRYTEPTILESGCGPAQWLYYALKKKNCKAIGLDIAASLLENVSQSRLLQPYFQAGRLELLEGDIRRAPIADASVDILLSFGVIEHMEDVNSAAAVRDFFRIVRPGGVALITTPNVYSVHTLTRPIAQRLGTWTVGFERSLTPRQLERHAVTSGFTVEQSGVLITGDLFGNALSSAMPPLRALSRWIEQRQIGLGFISYVLAAKP